MDIAHKETWFRLRLHGVNEPILINEGGFAKGMQSVMRAIMAAPNKYGPGAIEFNFKPMTQHTTQQEAALDVVMAGIDMSLVEQESDEEAAIWSNSPLNPDSDSYDPLFVSYVQCNLASFRETKTAEDLKILRTHVESKYRGTRWWDGAHKW